MTTDIDKLHKLIDDLEERPERIFNRGIGKTTLDIHKLAGQIQVGDFDRILVKIKVLRDMQWLHLDIRYIFAEQGIKVISFKEQPQPTLDAQYEGHQVRLYFFPEQDYQRSSRGFGSNSMEFNLIDY